MDLSTEKRKALHIAEEMLNRGDDDLLPFVALALRRCLEAVVYQKLWARKNWLPEDVARKWQPPQAFEALLELEPEAEHDSTLAIGTRDTSRGGDPGPFLNMGTEPRPRSKWLKKVYHKLGNFLHSPWPFAELNRKTSVVEVREFLTKTAAELTRYVENDLTFVFASTVTFVCSSCRRNVTVHSTAVGTAESISCLSCGCRFSIEKRDDTPVFHPILEYTTCECGAKIGLPAHELKTGMIFSCSSCSKRYKVTGQAWKYKADSVEYPS